MGYDLSLLSNPFFPLPFPTPSPLGFAMRSKVNMKTSILQRKKLHSENTGFSEFEKIKMTTTSDYN